MLYNIFSVFLLIIIIWALGVITISLLKIDIKFFTLSFSVGIPIFVLLTNFLYFTCYRSSEFTFIISLILALTSIIVLICGKKLSYVTLLPLLIVSISFILLLIPNIIGWSQYSTLRGNFYDNFIYLSEAVFIKAHTSNY